MTKETLDEEYKRILENPDNVMVSTELEGLISNLLDETDSPAETPFHDKGAASAKVVIGNFNCDITLRLFESAKVPKESFVQFFCGGEASTQFLSRIETIKNRGFALKNPYITLNVTEEQIISVTSSFIDQGIIITIAWFGESNEEY